jgi:hypothetical protein
LRTSGTMIASGSLVVPNRKYGNIPAEHQARYDRYLNRNPEKALSPDDWYKKAQTIWANNKGGNSFEFSLREYLGTPTGTGSKPISIDGFVPDLPVGSTYGVTDVKNVKYLSNSDQLRAFYNYADSNGMPFNIIVSPKPNLYLSRYWIRLGKRMGNYLNLT